MISASNIVISVGQAGNQIAASFWKALCDEHGIDPLTGKPIDGKEPIGNWHAFFEHLREKYIPRSLIVDLEPGVAENLTSSYKELFNPSNIITGVDGAGNNFAVGHFKMGSQFIEKVLNAMENEVQQTDHLGGIMVIHSLGGGSGSGFGTLIIKKLKELYPTVPILSCAIFPSPQVSSVVTEPYNAIFALDILKKYADAVLVLDNDALLNVAQKKLGLESPTLDDLNYLITELLTNITASMRFSGSLSVEVGLRELITNLVPHPNLHFLLTSTSPLSSKGETDFQKITLTEMTTSLFDEDSLYAACNPMAGRYLSVAVFYRGEIGDKPKADAELASMRDLLPFTDWIPTAFKVGNVDQGGVTRSKSMALIANNTEIAAVFEHICQKFDKLWQRKAFSFWYTNEGMEENEIIAMRQNIGELIKEYRAAAVSGTEYNQQDSVSSTTTNGPRSSESKETEIDKAII